MTEQALDQLARRVMLDAARLEYGSLPEEPHTFSPAFERKIKKLLRRGRHSVWYKALHAAACLLLALLLSGGAVRAGCGRCMKPALFTASPEWSGQWPGTRSSPIGPLIFRPAFK